MKGPSYSEWIPRNRKALLVRTLEVQQKHIKISAPKFTLRTLFLAKLQIADGAAFVLDPFCSKLSC